MRLPKALRASRPTLRSTVHRGAGGTEYQRVTLEADPAPVDKSGQSIYLGADGSLRRPVRFATGDQIIDPLDHGRLR